MLVPLLNKRGICEHKYSDNTAFYEKRKTFIKEPKSPIANTAHTCLGKGNSSLGQYWAEWDEIYCYPTQQSIQIKWVASLWTFFEKFKTVVDHRAFPPKGKNLKLYARWILPCFIFFWGGGDWLWENKKKNKWNTPLILECLRKNILSTIRMNKSTWRRY